MLTYAHGINTIANLAPLVARGGIFAPLADPAFFAIDNEIVWEIIQHQVPGLEYELETFLATA